MTRFRLASTLAATALALPLALAASLTTATLAGADGVGCDSFSGSCTAKATSTPPPPPAKPAGNAADNTAHNLGGGGHRQPAQPAVGNHSRGGVKSSGPSKYQRLVEAYQAKISAYEKAMTDYKLTLCAAGNEAGFACSAPTPPKAPNLPKQGLQLLGGPQPPQAAPQKGAPAPPPAPVVTPEQAAYMAAARLKLPATAPGVGPDPSVNEWNMVAIGYPLWLWADGPAHVGPVTDSVGGLSVSLEASISSMVFQMGDGQTVRCAGPGKPYGSWVEPGAESPSCGYVYQKPSLPNGRYTVTAVAYWSVNWQINGQSGVITIPRSSTRQLPVGELQAVVIG